MSKTQTQGLMIAVLLAVMGLVWTLNRGGGNPGPAPQSSGPTRAVQAAAEGNSPPAPAPAPAPAAPEPVDLARDYFEPPALLQKKLEEKRLQEEEERLRKEQRQPAGGPIQAPVISAAEVAQKFQLQGIFWGTAKPQAVINRRILSLGDHLDGAEVTSITKDRVVLSIEGQQFTLTTQRPE